jgi:asparagine synthase (glutamine-hydrolysing)
MCGLAAIYSYSGRTINPEVLARMTHALTHRGPDDYGFAFSGAAFNLCWREHPPEPFCERGVAMGHRRLSILDLSDAGHQPFASADGRYWMVYNGEVYNYIELRDELQKLGHQFHTGTDTEVVLSAYAEWGTDSFQRLNGMWAFLIWDVHTRTLVACRDRFGIKPLYFHKIDGAILFGSEIKAILQHPAAKREPDEASVVAYLARRAAPADGATFYAGVQAVKSGSWMSFDIEGRVRETRYWSLPDNRGPADQGFDDAASRLKELLSDSVRLRLRSDVKVGTMLSGGLDSTSVITLVAAHMGTDPGALAATGESLHSFTASFPGQSIDESRNINELCRQLPLTRHSVLPLAENNIQALLGGTAYSMEMPWFNSVPLVHALLMRRARDEKIKVVLNGHGADEVYAGYPYDYCPMTVADAFFGLRWGRAKYELGNMRRIHGFKAQLAVRAAQEQLYSGIKNRLGWGDSWTSECLVEAELLKKYPSPALQLGKVHSGLDRLLRTHFFEHMLPGWLHFEDRISMAYSIEARLPFMDYRLIEYGFSLPDEFKIRGGQTKAVLRKAMSGTVPRMITEDSRKIPFSGPDAIWLRGMLRPVTEELLGSGQPQLARFVDSRGLKTLLADFNQGSASALRLWGMLSAEVWLRTYFGDKIEMSILQ